MSDVTGTDAHGRGDTFRLRPDRLDAMYDTRSTAGYALRARLQAVVMLAGDGPGQALDAGAGTGRLCSALASHGWAVRGIDASTEMAAFSTASGNARVDVGSVEALPFDGEAFDLVTATGLLEYTGLAALRELVRVARRGARIVVSYPNPRAPYSRWRQRAFYPAAGAVRRAVGRGPLDLPTGRGPALGPVRFAAVLARAGIQLERVVFTSCLAVPSPLDSLLPAVADRAGRAAERRGGRAAQALATQVVYAGRRA